MPTDEQKRRTVTMFNRMANMQPSLAERQPDPGILLQHPERPILPATEQASTQRRLLTPSTVTMFNRTSRAHTESPLSQMPAIRNEQPIAREVFDTPEAKARAVQHARTAGQPFQEAYIRKMEGTVRDKEGRLVQFPDLGGGYSIGYGHHLKPEEIESGQITIGGQPVKYNLGLTEDQGSTLLAEDTRAHADAAKEVLQDNGIQWENLPPQAQTVVADLAYQIGPAGFARYKPLLKALRNEDWNDALNHVDRYYRHRDTGQLVHDTRRTNYAKGLLSELVNKQRNR